MKSVAKENLLQIRYLLKSLKQEQYVAKPEVLFGASIGQHIRHILEFYLLLISGSFSGIISYDKRQRDIRIENDIAFAMKLIDRLLKGLDPLELNHEVKYDADYSISGSKQKIIFSSIGRELAYCIEHSIHHQALIKAGLIVMGLEDITDEHFGVAYSTIRYRNEQCAQ